jgi:hypothetical protein
MTGNPVGNGSTRRLGLGTLAVLTALVVMFATAGAVPAQTSGRTGNYCAQDVGGSSCTANDTGVESLTITSVDNACNEAPLGQFSATFEVVLNATGAQNRYDIAMYIDKSGQLEGAYNGDLCYHDYLDGTQPFDFSKTPTYGDSNTDGTPDLMDRPWYDNDDDECGDIQSSTQAIKTVTLTAMPCADSDGDGFVNVHACASWRQNAQGACTSVEQAVPGTGSKCGCHLSNLDGSNGPPVPTAITLAAFEAAQQGGDILVTWETATELDNLGFNVYRSVAQHGTRIKLNASLIPGQAPGAVMGATYELVDETVTSGVTYYYWLEDVDAYGAASLHGPVSAELATVRRLMPARTRPVVLTSILQAR